jgi:NAD(P)-dependent dehydrogenase (short-subunit alcohol dehydrogenase family)
MTTNANVPTDRRLAAVSGASSGIGYELALDLAGRGYDLVINAEDAELEQAAAAVKDAGAGVTTVRSPTAGAGCGTTSPPLPTPRAGAATRRCRGDRR